MVRPQREDASMRQELKMTEALGKTLEGIEISIFGCQAVLTFTDGTFAALKAIRGYDAGDEGIVEAKLSLLEFGDAELIRVGIATAEELAVIRDDVISMALAKQDAAREIFDRKEFERLKLKFGA